MQGGEGNDYEEVLQDKLQKINLREDQVETESSYKVRWL